MSQVYLSARRGKGIAKALGGPSGRRSKFNATPTTVDGIRFHSAKEAKRYAELKLMEKAGLISDLLLQQKVPLVACTSTMEPVLIGHYIADFTYELPDGTARMEDVKGFRTPLYRWKKKHVEIQYGIQIRET